jgi:replicative DNA helicase
MVEQAERPKNAATTAVHRDVVTTAELAASLRAGPDQRLNHAVAVARAAVLPERDLPFPPYTLGAWLGDGTSRAHHGTAQAILRSMGVLGNKHIPAEYLRASEAQRRALLAGLLDTDGYAMPGGTVQFAVTSQRLAQGVLELVLSLGYRASMTIKPVRGRTPGSSTSYIITFTPDREVFRLRRKAVRQTAGLKAARSRYVTDVRPVPSVPVRCVQVDSPDHMYLASRSWIPTHNSTLALDLARAATVKHGLPCVIFSLEMGRNEITMRPRRRGPGCRCAPCAPAR